MENFDLSQFKITHVGIIVADIEASVKKAWEEFHVGPWRLDNLPENIPTWNRGKPVKSAQKVAFGKIAGMEVELIQPLENSKTYMLEELKNHGTGLSHAGIICDSLTQMEALADWLREHGYEEVHHAKAVGPMGDGGNYHFDTRKTLGFFLEISEPITITQEMIDREVWYPPKGKNSQKDLVI